MFENLIRRKTKNSRKRGRVQGSRGTKTKWKCVRVWHKMLAKRLLSLPLIPFHFHCVTRTCRSGIKTQTHKKKPPCTFLSTHFWPTIGFKYTISEWIPTNEDILLRHFHLNTFFSSVYKCVLARPKQPKAGKTLCPLPVSLGARLALLANGAYVKYFSFPRCSKDLDSDCSCNGF